MFHSDSKMAGKYITKTLIMTLLSKMGVKVASKSVAKFVPFVGSAVAGGISFSAMTYMGNRHIEECYQIALAALENERRKHEIIIEPASEKGG